MFGVSIKHFISHMTFEEVASIDNSWVEHRKSFVPNDWQWFWGKEKGEEENTVAFAARAGMSLFNL